MLLDPLGPSISTFSMWPKGFTLMVAVENKDSLKRMYLLEDLSYYIAAPGT